MDGMHSEVVCSVINNVVVNTVALKVESLCSAYIAFRSYLFCSFIVLVYYNKTSKHTLHNLYRPRLYFIFFHYL
jgi:hypothetical protein